MSLKNQIIEIYTDGSCHTQQKIGAWAALAFYDDMKIALEGTESDTTHNRMELIAVIRSIEYVLKEFDDFKLIKIFTDSQYVVQIRERAEKLILNNFTTKGGKKLNNTDLIKTLIMHLNNNIIEFIKVKAHQKESNTPNHNREVDKKSRQIVRQLVNK